MRICLGLSSIPDLIEVRKRNFMDRLIENDSYVALLKVFVANCLESNLWYYDFVSMCVLCIRFTFLAFLESIFSLRLISACLCVLLL